MVDDCSTITTNTEARSAFNGTNSPSEHGPKKQAIYGRSKESLTLLEAYQRLLLTKRAETVVVHGVSGSGKTALVNTLRNQLVYDQNPVYFVAGKYFQNEDGVQEPHSAIMAAFSDLFDLIAQSDDFDDRVQHRLKESMGSDAQLLIKSVSNLATLVGGSINQHDELGVAQQEDKASVGKFKVACKTFLRSLASDSHPVVIFLDDIQWSDEGSRQIIEMLLQDAALKNVMLILAYRQEETGDIESTLQHASAPVDIEVSNLDGEAVYQMVSAEIGLCTESVRHLSDLILKRTSGNALHVALFMETIECEGLLTYNNDNDGSCTFDVETIQMSIMASESLADLLERRIELLPQDITEILKIASMLGYHFDEPILVEVARTVLGTKRPEENRTNNDAALVTPDTVFAYLSDAMEGGFIEKLPEGYQFTHDKIQASFQACIDNQEKDHLHLLIGNAFLADDSDDQSKIYNAAVHLNRAPGFLCDPAQCVVLARLNLEAASYCEHKSSFFQAVMMLQKGREVIDSHEPWSEANFDLTYQIMESLARTQLIVGDFEGCKQTTTEALSCGKTVEMQISMILTDVEVRMAQMKVEESLAIAFQALRMLGVKMPKRVKLRHVLGKLLKVRRRLRQKTEGDILNLPLNNKPLETSSVKLLMHICAYCLVKDEVNTCIYAALLATELTLERGISPQSPSAFVFYGIAGASLGNDDRACKYGNLALKLLENMPHKETECFTVTFALTMITFRKESLQEFIDPLLRVAKAGYKRGDILYATLAMSHLFFVHFSLGTNLALLETSMRENVAMASDLSQDGIRLWFLPALQYTINMQSRRSRWDDIAILSGEFMDEENYFQEAGDAGYLVLNLICSLIKAEIASSFWQFSFAAKIYDEVRSSQEDTVRITYAALAYYYNAARTYYSLYEESGKRQHLRKGRRYHKLLKWLKADNCPNAIPFVACLDAQTLTHRKHIHVSVIRAAYDRGIDSFAEHHLLMFEGCLNEKAGFDFAARGMLETAESYFKRAIHLYRNEIGAMAKHDWLVKNSHIALFPLRQENALTLHGTLIIAD